MTTKVENIIDKALTMIASGKSITATAKECGISRQTLSDAINNNIDYYNRLQDIRQAITDDAVDRLRGLYSTAIDYVQDVLTDDKAPTQERLHAALAIIKTPKATIDAGKRKGMLNWLDWLTVDDAITILQDIDPETYGKCDHPRRAARLEQELSRAIAQENEQGRTAEDVISEYFAGKR